MSETVNIAALASSASEKIFLAFGWNIGEIKDENFPCEKQEKHQTKTTGGTHPVDCVFSYADPFSNKRVFLLCDLKSYAKSSIKTTDFAPYIRGISKAIDCAAVSEKFKARYIPTAVVDWIVEGMLFVYNHDGEYDQQFREKARGLTPSSLPHNPSVRVHLLGPDDIAYLQAIVANMKIVCSENDLDYVNRHFFYPQQVLHTPGNSLMPIATIEMLRSRLLIVGFKKRAESKSHYHVYLRSKGTMADFEYVITYLYRNGVMSLATSVEIKGPNFLADAHVHFDLAKDQFWQKHYRMNEIKESLDRIKYGRVDTITSVFSSMDEAKYRNK